MLAEKVTDGRMDAPAAPLKAMRGYLLVLMTRCRMLRSWIKRSFGLVSILTLYLSLASPLLYPSQGLPTHRGSSRQDPRANVCSKLKKKSKRWLENAAERGNADAMNQLGYRYMKGQGVPRNLALARQWLEKSAALQNACAMNNLGMKYYDEGDFTHAREWFAKAVALGNADAMASLGSLYEFSPSWMQDLGKAMTLYKKGAILGSEKAIADLGMAYCCSFIRPLNYAKARYWFKRAASQGDSMAMHYLGEIYEHGAEVPQNFKQARRWYEKSAAAEGGDLSALARAESMYELGWIYEEGLGVQQDYVRARGWYEKAAALGRRDAMRRLAILYNNGLGVKLDPQKARVWQHQAFTLLEPSTPPFWGGTPLKDVIPVCTSADVDANIQAADDLDSYHTLAFDLRNISGHACKLNQADFLGYAPYTFPDGKGVQECRDCAQGPPARSGPSIPPIPLILEDREVAHATYEWKTQPGDQSTPCLKPNWVTASVNRDKHQFWLIAPDLLKGICSPVEIGDYVRGNFVETTPPTSQGAAERPVLKLIPATVTFYPGERIEVHARATEPVASLAPDEKACPRLIQRTRSPDGTTRWDEFGGPGDFPWCRAKTLKSEEGERQIEMTFDSGHNSRWGDYGWTHLTLLQIAGHDGSGNIIMAESNTIGFHIADSAKIRRDWGPKVKGVAVNVTLDKHEYELHHDIPLHIATENFSARFPIISAGLRVAVRDVCGHTIKESYFSPGVPFFIYVGNGLVRGPGSYARGVVVPTEWSLMEKGQLPNKPGPYTVTVTWSVQTCAITGCPQYGGLGLIVGPATGRANAYIPYATVQDTAAFRIVDSEHPDAGFLTVPISEACSDAGVPGFRRVATSFGPFSAVLDKATRLEWLDLDVTAGLSFNDVKKNLRQGGKFHGWQFATPNELRKFFADFDGSPDGHSRNAALAEKLQRDLGGPLKVITGLSGWRREYSKGYLDAPYKDVGFEIYGYIMLDNRVGAIIDPAGGETWYVPHPQASDDLGSFLVRAAR
jgi:TPR repeat protein